MAHRLNYNNSTGKHSFFSTKQKAWHGLGQIVDRYPTSAEAIKYAGLDYTVEKRHVFSYAYDVEPENVDNDVVMESRLDIPNFFATVRTDTDQVLGVVGKDYEIVQNREAFSFFDAIVGGGEGILYETAGALGNGERIFITAKLPGYIRVGKDDLIEKYLFLTTSHDGYGSITAAFTPIRVVCNNTLNAAMNNLSNSVKIRHTQSAKERLLQAHKVMGLTNTLSSDLNGIFNNWARIRITDKDLVKLILQAMAPNKEVLQNITEENIYDYSSKFTNIAEKVSNYALGNETQLMETTKGTLFGAYNAITGYFQNVMHYKNEEAKLKSILFGNGYHKTQSAFNLCRQYEVNGDNVFNMN